MQRRTTFKKHESDIVLWRDGELVGVASHGMVGDVVGAPDGTYAELISISDLDTMWGVTFQVLLPLTIVEALTPSTFRLLYRHSKLTVEEIALHMEKWGQKAIAKMVRIEETLCSECGRSYASGQLKSEHTTQSQS